MAICSPQFLIFCGVVAVLFHQFPQQRLRRLFLSIANLAFLIPFVPNPASWVCFAVFLGGTFAVLRLVRVWPSRLLVFLTITLVIAAFLFVKHYSFLEWVLPPNLLTHPVVLVGLSYMLFKFIHMLVDEWQGALEPFGFVSYLNYQLAFFTLIAGPIQRYNDFRQFWEEMDKGGRDDHETLLAWNRILTGMIKMGVVAPLVWYVFEEAGAAVEAQQGEALLPQFAISLYAYPVFLYFNFSGYTDLAIGSARLLGCQLPENFNQPYLGRNVIDFWNRWHMSLTNWIRDYLFMTSYKAGAERFPQFAKYLGWFLVFFALCVAGIWHGSTMGFMVFGALNGLGAAVNQALGDFLRQRLGRAGFQRYQKSRLVEVIAIFATLNYMGFCFLFFSLGVSLGWERLSKVGHELLHSPGASFSRGGTCAIVLLLMLTLVVATLWWKDAIMSNLNRCEARWNRSTPWLYGVMLVKAVFVVVVLVAFWIFQQKDPVVVYMKF